MFAMLASGCSVVLTQGPPKPGESDYDATGAYPGGVPCTSSRDVAASVDLGLMLWVLAVTVNYDNRDDQIDGSLTAAAAAIYGAGRGGKRCRAPRRRTRVDRLPADEGVPGCSGGGRCASVASRR